MKNSKKRKKNIPLKVLISTSAGLVLSVVLIALFSFWIVKYDTNITYYFIFLLTADFFGALIAAYIFSRKAKSKRFFLAIAQGILSGSLFFLIIATVNSFSFIPQLYFIPLLGAAAGSISGLITSNLR